MLPETNGPFLITELEQGDGPLTTLFKTLSHLYTKAQMPHTLTGFKPAVLAALINLSELHEVSHR